MMMMTGKQQHYDDPCPSLTTTATKSDACNNGDDGGNNDADETSSINSQQEALCEMLGLPLSSFTLLTLQEDNDDDGADGDETRAVSSTMDGRKNGDDENEAAAARIINISWINLPPNASRYFYPSSQCTAFCIPQLFTMQECQYWIDLAAGAAPNSNKQQAEHQHQQRGGFQYITHATHTTPDGSTSFLVEIQNPNPHKLSVFHHAPSVDLIWNRLLQSSIVYSFLPNTNNNILQKLLDREACGEPVGLNPRLRVLKYDAVDQDEFKPHFDATTRINGHNDDENQMISLLTVLIYLNTGSGVDFAGGDTLFLNHGLDTSSGGGSCSNNNNNNNNKDTPGGVVAVTPTVGSVVIFEHDLYHASTTLEWGTKYVLRTDILFRLAHDPKEKQFQKQQQQRQRQEQQKEEPSDATATITCCCSTMAHLCEKLQVSSKDMEALEELGMLGLSLDAFCGAAGSGGGPGKFALYQILQSVGISTPNCRALIEGAYAERKRVE